MVYQVNSNVAALNVYNNLGVHQAKSAAALARISSGLKAAGGGDVASQGTAATINASLQATQSSISQVQSAINQLQVADTAYGELIALGQKGVEVGQRGADAGADASALWSQLTALAAGIASIQTNTQYNGAVFTTASAPDVGVTTFTVTPTVGTAPTVAGASAAAATAADAVTTGGSFTTYVSAMVDIRATNAGRLASLQNTLQVLNSVAANEVAGISQAQDTDIAKEMMNLTSANIMTEAATAMLAQAMQLPNTVLKLVQ
jgi:flagellin